MAIHTILQQPTTESKPFWDGCNEEQLRLPYCPTCREAFYYPRLYCPKCGGDSIEWTITSGRGVVHAATQVEVSFYGPDWEPDLPYTVILVDLDEGPRMLSRVVPDDTDRVRCGARVRVTFIEVEEQKLPFFALDEEDVE